MRILTTSRAFAIIEVDETEKHIFRTLMRDVALLLGDGPDDGEGEIGSGAEAGSGLDTGVSSGAEDGDAEDTGESGVLSDADLERMVGISTTGRPADPAVLRLLPDVDGDDAERSAEFRRLTEHDLREQKLANLRIALFDLASSGRLIELDETHARAWAQALNDVRLVLATRMNMASDADVDELYAREDADELDAKEASMLSVYDFFSWAQERLTSILLMSLGGDSEIADFEDQPRSAAAGEPDDGDDTDHDA